MILVKRTEADTMFARVEQRAGKRVAACTVAWWLSDSRQHIAGLLRHARASVRALVSSDTALL